MNSTDSLTKIRQITEQNYQLIKVLTERYEQAISLVKLQSVKITDQELTISYLQARIKILESEK